MRKLSFLVAFAVMSLVSTATFAQELDGSEYLAKINTEESVKLLFLKGQ